MIAVWAFLKGVSWSKLIPVLKWVAILACVWLGLSYLRGAVIHYQETVRDQGRQDIRIEQAEQDLSVLEQQLAGERVARAAAEARVKLLQGDYEGYKKATQDQINALKNHDLRRLVNAKPRTIERLANAATADRFKQIEALVNAP